MLILDNSENKAGFAVCSGCKSAVVFVMCHEAVRAWIWSVHNIWRDAFTTHVVSY